MQVQFPFFTMNEPPSLPEKSVPPEPARGGIDIHGGDVRAARDIVAGDVNVAGDSISGQTVSVQRGYSANEVQRLILIVGGLVFLTATCFFIFGAVSAAALVNAVNRDLPGGSSQEAAQNMAHKIDALNSLSPGQEFRVSFSEDEVSSYFRFLLGPAIDVADGKARFLETPGRLAISGKLDNGKGLPFLAEAELTKGAVPFQLRGAWVKIIPTPDGWSFGWVPVTPLAQDLSGRINNFMFGRVQFTEITKTTPEGSKGEQLNVWGVAK